MDRLIVECLAVFSAFFLTLYTMVLVRHFIKLGCFLRAKRRVLNLDLIEEHQQETSEDYRALILRKWGEQDQLLRWRIMRSLQARTTKGKKTSVVKVGERMLQDPDVFIRGMIWRQWKFIARFPFVKLIETESMISLMVPSSPKLFIIPNMPTELVRDASDLWLIRLSLR
jgi:hypothetical protein